MLKTGLGITLTGLFLSSGFSNFSLGQSRFFKDYEPLYNEDSKNDTHHKQREFAFELPRFQDRLRETYADQVESRKFKDTEGFCFDTAIGYRMTHANGENIFGTSARFALEHSDEDTHFIRGDINTIFDQGQDKDKIDFDRYSMWHEGSLRGARYFNQNQGNPESQLLFGVKGCFEAIENSPTSTEHAMTLSLMQSTAVLSGSNTFIFDIGAYGTQFELDDDVPSTKGYGREGLKLDALGVVCGASATHEFENGIVLSARARAMQKLEGNYSEYNFGAEVEVPLSLLFGESCQFWVRGTVEQRFFDLGDRADALPFNDDLFSSIEFVWRGGTRSRLTRGY
jgi:hypothetical protein